MRTDRSSPTYVHKCVASFLKFRFWITEGITIWWIKISLDCAWTVTKGTERFVVTVDLRLNDAVNVTVLVDCCHFPTRVTHNHQSSHQLHADWYKNRRRVLLPSCSPVESRKPVKECELICSVWIFHTNEHCSVRLQGLIF